MPYNENTDEYQDWSYYQKLVLHELDRLNSNIEGIDKRQQEMALNLENIKIKSGFLAALAGIISSFGYNFGKNFLDK